MRNSPILVALVLTSCAGLVPSPKPIPNPTQPNPTATATPAPLPSSRVNPARPTPPSNNPSKLQRNLTYCSVDGVDLKLDLYFPAQTLKPSPVAVFVHGGGWSSGDKAGGNLIPFSDLASQGFFVAAVNYRLAPRYKFPTMIEDVKCAVRFLRANAVKLNIDPNRIGAWGGSAGGHLVALLGTTDASAGFDVGQYADQPSRVQAVVDMFGPTDLNEMFPSASERIIQNVFEIKSSAGETAKLASPVTYVTSDDPPFLILQGDKDQTVPPKQSQVLYDRLKGVGVPATLVMVKNAGHGFAPAGGAISPTREELIGMIAGFFNQTLK
jgi:acetyl esterase/lipase